MINSFGLKKLLGDIDIYYQHEINNNRALLWAKMAIIEVSGWTEECIDNILKTYIDSVNPNCKTALLDKIDKVYGFHYSSNFKKICVEILGNIMFEKIEKKIPSECQKLESALNELNKTRNICAHTHILSNKPIDAPQKSMLKQKEIETGLKKFIVELKKVKI